jgi:hypothetical protein
VSTGTRTGTGTYEHRPGQRDLTLWQRFVEVNRPGPPEHSVSFRAASVAAVLVGIGACWSEGLLSPAVTLFAVAATVVGNVVRGRGSSRSWPCAPSAGSPGSSSR